MQVSLFLIKLQALGNFIKKEALAQVFSCEFCEIFKNTFFNRTTPEYWYGCSNEEKAWVKYTYQGNTKVTDLYIIMPFNFTYLPHLPKLFSSNFSSKLKKDLLINYIKQSNLYIFYQLQLFCFMQCSFPLRFL